MKLLFHLDAGDYDEGWPVFHREAVRGVILRDGKLAMVRSGKKGYFKFPGGGIEPGETQTQALIREVREETGLQVLPKSIRPYGLVYEKRRSVVEPDEIFEQYSYHYWADVAEELSPTHLDDYEAELDYHLEWTTPAEALRWNLSLPDIPTFVLRETQVLHLLAGE